MTKMMSLFPCVTLVLTSLVMCSDSASILFVLPVSTRSHKNVFAPLAQALAARGHAVTMFSSHLSKHGLDGVREFAVPGMMDRMEVGSKILWSQMGQTGVVNNLFTLFFLGKLGSEACDKMLSMPEVQAALRGQVRYDLVVQSVFFEESCLALAGKSDTPFIYMSTAGNWAHLAHAMGHAELTSAEPSILLTFTDHMTFWERVVNTVQYHAGNAVHHLLTLPMHERVLHKHWPDAPPVRDLHANASMAFLNTAPGVDYRNTLPATFLEVGGMHCQAPKDIPKELEDWVSGSSNGFIYFSLGSAVQGKMMPEKFRKMFVEAFARFPQYRILWKWETEVMDDLPKHVKLSKWLPQQDLLGHKDIKLFITHGGLLSTQEATYHGVPVVGIPIGADQMLNMKRTENEGAGLTLEWSSLTTEGIYNAVLRVLSEPSFRENLKRRSAIMRDQPQTPLDRAVYWTEYVIRHKGAAHLRSAARDLTWWQYHLLDVWLFVGAVLLGFLLVAYFVTRCFLRCLGRKLFGVPAAMGDKKRQ